MEGHPKENHNGEDQQQGDDALTGVGRRKFVGLCIDAARLGFLLIVDVGMLKSGTECHVDGHRDDERDAGHGKPIVVGF